MCLTTIFMVDLARRPTNFQLPKFAQHVRRYSVAVGPEDSEEDGETSPSANLYGGHSSSHDRGASDGGLPPMGRTPTPKSSALTPTPKSGDTLTPQAAADRMSSHGSLGRMSSHGSLGRLSPTTSLPSASSGHNTAVVTDFERSDGINIVTGGEDVNREYGWCHLVVCFVCLRCRARARACVCVCVCVCVGLLFWVVWVASCCVLLVCRLSFYRFV